MDNNTGFKMGSKIVDGGKVYKVFKIENVDTKFGVEKILHYCPYFATTSNQSLFCSIPEKNIGEAIRNPVSKKVLRHILNSLTSKSDKHYAVIDANDAVESFRLNDIGETARILRYYLREQKKEGESYTRSKRNVITQAIELMVEEVALVFGITIESAREKIRSFSS